MSDAMQHIFWPYFVSEAVWKNNFHANIKWIYISYFSGSSGSREPCVVLETLPGQSGPDFSRAESIIPSHADWLGYIRMTALNLCALSSCLCTLPGGCATFKSRPDVHICIPFRTQGNNTAVIVMQSLLLFPSYLRSIWMWTKAQDYLQIHSKMFPNHTCWHTPIQ